jgi:hypothetical protein
VMNAAHSATRTHTDRHGDFDAEAISCLPPWRGTRARSLHLVAFRYTEAMFRDQAGDACTPALVRQPA